jgi:hypothetical protein
MLHIVNNLNHYATTRVVVGPGEDFINAARDASCLADLAAALDAFLSLVSNRCLLNPKADTVASLIRMLPTLALRFSSAFRILADAGDVLNPGAEAAALELQVVSCELQFVKCLRFSQKLSSAAFILTVAPPPSSLLTC